MRVTRWPNAAVHTVLERRPRRIGTADPGVLRTTLQAYEEYDTVFVHVGLSDVNAALPGNPYETVLDALTANFAAVLTPGFTDYFKTSGVYDKQHSKPKHGTFARLFLEDADYRTDDACKSILVLGSYRFDGRDHRHSYAVDGCFEQLGEDDVLLVSVGTPWVICSYLHHLEARNDVPYMEARRFEGVMHDAGRTTEIEQTTHYYDGRWTFNKLKLQRDLRKRGVLDSYDFEGLRVFVAPLSELDRVVTEKMASDPYYLVT